MATHVEPETPKTVNTISVPAEQARNTKLVQLAILGALFLIAFWPILVRMYDSWFDERSYMEHGILVIPAVAYMIWSDRQRLSGIRQQPSRWGILFLVWGILQAVVGMLIQWAFVERTALLVSIVGLVLIVFGVQMLRALTYPICTLMLMITPPVMIYDRLTLSLQLLASRIGEAVLEAFGYSVLREGNILELVGVKLSVEEACSGIRSLFSIIFMCTLYNFFFVRGRLTKTVILVMAVPIAILSNAGRIVATGMASQYNRALIEGVSHETFGYVSVALAAIGCLGVHSLTVWLYSSWRVRHAH